MGGHGEVDGEIVRGEVSGGPGPGAAGYEGHPHLEQDFEVDDKLAGDVGGQQARADDHRRDEAGGGVEGISRTFAEGVWVPPDRRLGEQSCLGPS